MYTDLLTKLYLDHFQFCIGNDRMAASGLHGHHITGTYRLLHAVHDRSSVSGNDSPHFIAELMAVIVHAVSRIQGYLDGHAALFDIQHPEASPGFFRKHDLLVNGIHIGLDIAGLLLIGYKDNALEEFNEKMAALSEAVEALSETDRANFMEYCGKSYDKYFSLYELTSGKVKVELTDEEKALFDELHTTVKQYFIVYANIYSIVQQGNKVSDDAYPILYALYARVSTIRNNILATARPEAILMLYTAEYDINTVMYSLEKAYYLADNITSSLLTSMTAMVSKGDGTVSYTTYWDLYTAYGFDKFLSDMCDILYASYFTDGKTIDHAMLLSAMAKYREFTTFETSIFTLMNIDDTFYRSLNVYYKSVLTEGGLEFSQSLVEAERAYLLYTLSTSNEENRTAFITAMEAVISDYENLSAEDKAYLDDMYNYYVKILEDVKKDTEAVA